MSLNKREKRSFIISLGVHAIVIAVMAYGLFSVPSLPEPPQGEMAIDFDLSGGFNNISVKKSPENISKKPVKKSAGKKAQADVGQKEIVRKIATEKKKKEQERLEIKKAAAEKAEAEKRKQDVAAKKKTAEEKRKRDLEIKKEKERAENKAEEEKREKELALKKEKELSEKKEAEAQKKKELAEKKHKEAEAQKKKELAEKKLKEAEETKKKELAEKKRKEAEEKKKKAFAEKKRKEAEEKKKKELAEKKRKEAEKKKQALLEKKKKEEGQKKRFNDDRIANLLKSKDNNRATQQKTTGSGRDPVADILSKTSAKETGAAGRQGNQNTSNAHKLGGGLSWSDKAAIVSALRPCWESYQTIARGDVIVDFSLDGRGYLKGNVGYVSGDRSAFSGAKRAVPECASPIRGIDLKKLSGGKDFRITFTPLDIRF